MFIEKFGPRTGGGGRRAERNNAALNAPKGAQSMAVALFNPVVTSAPKQQRSIRSMDAQYKTCQTNLYNLSN